MRNSDLHDELLELLTPALNERTSRRLSAIPSYVRDDDPEDDLGDDAGDGE